MKSTIHTLVALLLLSSAWTAQGSDTPSKIEQTVTIAGTDTNANSIRNDVKAFIAATYPEPAQRKAAQQFAAVIQAAILVDKKDTVAVKAISIRGSRAVNCIYLKFDGAPGSEHPAAVVEKIKSITTNTKQRLLAYHAYAKALDGTTLGLPNGDTCE